MTLRTFYPEIEANFTDFIKVDEQHTIYYEESGNPKGQPVIFLHGGPGCGSSPTCRRYFAPEFYRIIVFDQRGSGKSTPHACLENNDTWHIIEDIEKIRQALNIEKWLVFGGSWGATLALCYAIKHPERVQGLVLRGIFLGRREDIEWIYEIGGASNIQPEAFEKYISIIPEEERKDIISAYYRRLTSDDREDREQAAKEWSMWEGNLVTLLPDPNLENSFGEINYAISMATIECHFWMNNMFWDDDNYILNNVDVIKDVPTIIVHGRYDIDCRVIGAYELSKKLNNCELNVVVASGHSSGEAGIVDGLIKATDKFREILK
ncbi:MULTISPECIES: prolyl aminopeptidase [unclassified Gemella]|uniref:prolyl aminopeptidase n=1 Tax=unclassified Gemella TaxID=2624949 RepID=UPI001C044C83|nr:MULTISPECIES: prolyl aminopeptidase [unclassified Gemella]MBU0278969.1 prolyl aminopeptidase [Gemella sp. zg-1178]QWQ39076.1 prolyl aminopeptidase [Gemella sp. zg-570]